MHLKAKAAAAALAVAASAVTAVTAVSAAPAPDGRGALADVTWERIGGADRFATERLVSQRWLDSHDDRKVDRAVLVGGEWWPDAVAAAPLAGDLGTFVMLGPPGGPLRDRRLQGYLDRLGRIETGGTPPATSAKAVKVAVVAGPQPNGAQSVPAILTDRIESDGIDVLFASGPDRYRTALAAAEMIDEPGRLDGIGRTAILATGEGGTQGFADSLAAGPLAYKHRLPVLLTPSGRLHPDVAKFLADKKIEHVILMGGTRALKPAVERAVRRSGATVKRIAGNDRYETAALFAAYAARVSPGCFDGPHYGLSTGLLPFDALAASPLLAERCAPVLFTRPDRLPEATEDYLNDARRRAFDDSQGDVWLTVLGAQSAVADSALVRYRTANLPTQKYRYRSPDSALPAVDWYFNNHTEIAAEPAWAECVLNLADAGRQEEYAHYRSYVNRFRGFDREILNLPFQGGYEYPVAVGWWSDGLLRELYKESKPDATTAWARKNVHFDGEYQMPVFRGQDFENFEWLRHQILEDQAFWNTVSHQAPPPADNGGALTLYYARHSGTTPPMRITERSLLTANNAAFLGDYPRLMLYIYPRLEEPGAWAHLTLMAQPDRRYFDNTCLMNKILARCGKPFTAGTPPHLRNDEKSAPFGRYLWNLVCGENPALPEGWEPEPPLRTIGTAKLPDL